MLREMQKAIDPSPGLHWSLRHWDEIANDLRESSRKRRSQHQLLAQNIKVYKRLQ